MIHPKLKHKLLHISVSLVVLSALVLTGLFGVYQSGANSLRMGTDFAVTERNGWTVEDDEQTRRDVTLPLKHYGKPGERISLTKTVSVTHKESYAPVLFFTVKYVDAHVFFDGERVLRHETSGNSALTGRYYFFLPLPKEKEQVSVRIELVPFLGRGVACKLPAPMVGDKVQIIYELLRPEILLSVLLVAIASFGVLLLLFNLQVLGQSAKISRSLLYTGLFAILFSAYSFCVTNMVQLVVNNGHVLYYLEFLLLALLPVPLLLLVGEKAVGGVGLLPRTMLKLVLLNFFVQTLLLLTPIEPRRSVISTHVLIVLSIAAAAATVLVGERRPSDRRRLILTFMPLLLGSLWDLASFYLPHHTYSITGFQIGVFLFAICEAYSLTRSYLQYYKRNLEADVFHKMAYTDALTGLKNRAAYEQRIEELARDMKGQAALWCAVADINGLKSVNDTFGHHKGDAYIRDAAGLLQSLALGACEIYRTGGDEFVIFMQNITPEQVEERLEHLRIETEEYNCVRELKLSIAIGYDWFRPGQDSSVAELIVRADAKMYEDKRSCERARLRSRAVI